MTILSTGIPSLGTPPASENRDIPAIIALCVTVDILQYVTVNLPLQELCEFAQNTLIFVSTFFIAIFDIGGIK